MPERNFAMIDLPDHASQLAILDQPMAKPLHDLIAGRVSNAATLGLADLTHIVVITRADDPAAVTVALGFDPLYSRLDQTTGIGWNGTMSFSSWFTRWLTMVSP
jgi:hypothetical protein